MIFVPSEPKTVSLQTHYHPFPLEEDLPLHYIHFRAFKSSILIKIIRFSLKHAYFQIQRSTTLKLLNLDIVYNFLSLGSFNAKRSFTLDIRLATRLWFRIGQGTVFFYPVYVVCFGFQGELRLQILASVGMQVQYFRKQNHPKRPSKGHFRNFLKQ